MCLIDLKILTYIKSDTLLFLIKLFTLQILRTICFKFLRIKMYKVDYEYKVTGQIIRGTVFFVIQLIEHFYQILISQTS